jgi:hypothetical protein
MHQLKLTCPDGIGHHAAVELDGHQITTALSSVALRIAYGEPVTTILEVAAYEYTAYDGKARVYLSEETRDLLKRLGWTPPAEGEEATANGDS